MRTAIILFFLLLSCSQYLQAQPLYFPPLTGNTWETTSPQSLDWCIDKIDSLYAYLDATNTKGFILIKDGKIVLEKYFGSFTQDSLWYWASAGKTMTAFLVGIAQQEALLNIHQPSATFLGNGWTSAPPEKEQLITIRHQLTMTTGLDDGVANNDCTDPSCLQYIADAGERWAYHNAPYTLLDGVIAGASGQSLNTFFASHVRNKIGMNGAYIPVADNNVLFSTPRSMARFGLLLLNKGKWGNTDVLSDTAYFQAMTNTSQNLNPSYGYLTWLNGKNAIMVPGSQIVFPVSLCPPASPDMFAAMGKNGQLINVVPSKNLVMIRMGNIPDNSFVPFAYQDEIWVRLNEIICSPSAVYDTPILADAVLYPNPSSHFINIQTNQNLPDGKLFVYDVLGTVYSIDIHGKQFSTTHLPKGIYFLPIKNEQQVAYKSFTVVR